MGWNAKTTKQLLTRSGTIDGQFTLPLIQGYVTAEGFPSQPGSSGYELFVTKPPSYQG